METLEPNTISFKPGIENPEEILKLCPNGDIYYKGRLIENDKEIVEAMREFLKSAGFIKNN